MGFAQSQCELAMELAMNNAEVALNYLLTGEIVAAAPAATSNGQQPFQSTAESYFGQGCGAVTACDVSQYSFGERGGRSACTAIALEAATTLLHPSSGLFSTSAAPPNPPTGTGVPLHLLGEFTDCSRRGIYPSIPDIPECSSGYSRIFQ